jgi:hypothetical protein
VIFLRETWNTEAGEGLALKASTASVHGSHAVHMQSYIASGPCGPVSGSRTRPGLLVVLRRNGCL